MSDRTEAESIAKLVSDAIAPRLEQIDNVQYLILKDGATRTLESLQQYPRRKRATACFIEPEGFIQYLLAHQEPGTIITGDVTEKSGTFRAIIDYPHAGEQGLPKWGEHVAALQLQITPEWARWIENDTKSKAQSEFAEFLEDNACDIVEPSGADLLEVASTLEAAKGVNFRSATRLANGQHQLRYEETLDARAGQSGQMQVPETFTIEISPFVGTPRTKIRARLRYRIDQGRLTFHYRLMQPHLVILAAWMQARVAIEMSTTRKVQRGSAQVTNPFARG